MSKTNVVRKMQAAPIRGSLPPYWGRVSGG